jgi:DNA-directed RNA polymerase subunit RPC12/RpoP
MTIDFTCVKCEGSFELDSQDIIDGTEKLECPHCNVKATQVATDDFIAALTEVTAQVAVISKKFTLTMAIESADLDEPDDEEEDEKEGDEDADDDEDEDDDDDDEDEDEDEEKEKAGDED